ncbi:MAG TPA: CdaR family protein [Metabacillus sp.]|nr:CdaR family protein [Metabacillus sp.]
MDKLMNNHWVMRVIALFLALMLYASVNIETGTQANKPSTPLSSSSLDTAVVTDIPVVTYFDEEDLVVTGVPETVNVTLEGPTGSLIKARQQKDFEVYAELTNLSIGSHRVNLKIKNLSSDLKASISPSVITVSIEEKISKDFPVEVEYINEDKLEEGYTPDQPIVSPNSVRITASKEIIDRISKVQATINLEAAKETINKESRITIYDSDGNILPVEVEPSVVDVTVPIKSPSKALPFKVVREGELKKGLSILSMETEPKEITVYGPLDVLDSYEFIDGVTVDLSEIEKDTVLEVDVPIPEGIEKVSPETIKIDVDVDEQEEKSFSNKKIEEVGMAEGKVFDFLDPDIGEIDVKIYGAPSVINEITSDDIELYINLSNLSDGEHEVQVQVNSPQNITWSLEQEKIKVRISSAS